MSTSSSIPHLQKSFAKILLIGTGLTHNGVRVAKDLHDAGSNVVMHCPQASLACALRSVRTIHPARGRRSDLAILRSLRRESPQLLIPCDDEAVRALHAIYSACPAWRPLIQRSLGLPASFPAIASRSGLLQALAGIPEIALPAWTMVHSQSGLETWHAQSGAVPCVLKREDSAGGVGVRIVRHPRQMQAAFDDLTRRATPWLRSARAARDYAFNLSRPVRPAQPVVIAQRYIQGAPANAAVFCREGEVLACIALETLTSSSETSPAATVLRIHHPPMEQAVRAAVKHLGLSGFHGFDFILEEGTRTPWLLELNPRITPVAHLPLGAGSDLIAACVAELHPGRTFQRPPLLQPMIALFPRQVAIDPRSPYLKIAYHDIDWTAPELVLAGARQAKRNRLLKQARNTLLALRPSP